MSGYMGSLDQVSLEQKGDLYDNGLRPGDNYYDEKSDYMRNRIISFITPTANLDLDEARLKSLKDFVETAPDSTIREIYSRMMSIAEAAEMLSWKNKLKKYITGSPPPLKYETGRGTRTPLQFLEDVWGEYLDHNVLYQDDLTAYDDRIIPAIYNYWNKHPRQPTDRLPLPKRDRTEAIISRVIAHGPDSLEDVMKAIRAYARREDRQR